MAERPAIQFYPAEWRSNAKLRRCSHAARGAWMDTMCLLHDSDEYGVLRWPLEDIAHAAGLPVALLRELATKGVLKGGDSDVPAYTYRPFHAGKHGAEVVLVASLPGPCWYCSRFVKDEWKRHQRGKASQFSTTNQPPKAAPMPPIGERQGEGSGERQGDGPSSSASASSSKKQEQRATRLPADWTLTPERKAYCQSKRPDLDPIQTFEDFEDWYRSVAGNGGLKTDWDRTWQRWVRNQRTNTNSRNIAPAGGRTKLA